MDLWTEIKKLQGKELETPDQRKAFVVCEVLADRVIIKTSREKERAVHWKEIPNSYGSVSSAFVQVNPAEKAD